MLKEKSFQILDFIKIGKKVLSIEKNNLSSLYTCINQSFQEACEMILSCFGKIICIGIGKSGHIARKLASTFSSTGTPSFFIHPGEANHGDLGMISKIDMIIIISHSGESKEIISLIPFIKKMKIPVICITGNKKSTIGKFSKIKICIKIVREACPFGLTPTSSTTATLVICDALAIAILQAKQFTSKDFYRSHPGGFLGRKSMKRVKDFIKFKKNIPKIDKNFPLKKAIFKILYKKNDIFVICRKKNLVEGIFTKEDAIYILQKNINLENKKIYHFMKKIKIFIHPNTKLKFAIQLMKEKKLSTLLVLKKNKIVGILYIHDII
ncbi:KpsF/GutQ family sugar-phosphate isomerase [bacterium endosymbiont of Pedicinus badii]|uniref:KpsF/GutQ family sugar-phosphate isomerase n=1 Tax=bacterium endosymbiont of Pedicinus badii TaxID=1719126 RepID=UPI0009BA0E62|nr:KpsF/GutQ family sugar-phosphate isomerase [bacterium endosymbiont of Pedicinus badii]OQM34144.1 hypothetical protein AOQ89_02270 [bacterium endosymbiont of Pedicinus badii]